MGRSASKFLMSIRKDKMAEASKCGLLVDSTAVSAEAAQLSENLQAQGLGRLQSAERASGERRDAQVQHP